MDPEQDEYLLPVSRELVDALERMIPERCPDLNERRRDVWHYAGQRAVVRLLQRHLKARMESNHVL